jgi:hypothetical protein
MIMKTKEVFRVVVDYSKSLAEMIKEGKYNWHDPAVSRSHFPVKGKGKISLNLELLNYGKFMKTDNIFRDMDSCGLRPATIFELLALGATYPEKQLEFPIIALGSVWPNACGDGCVGCLRRDVEGRGLYLSLYHGPWRSHYRFAAVRK